MQYSSKNNLKLMQGSDKIQRQDFVDNFEIIDDGLSKFYVATLTSENVYKVTTGLNKTSLSNGYSVRVAIPSNSSGAVSITIDTVTVPVKKSNGTAVTMLYAGAVYTLNYYNSVFTLASEGSSGNVSFTSDKLLTGYSANDTNGEKIEGTMPNNGAVFPTLNCGGFYTIPKGYHSGAGVVTTNSLASQTPGNAGPENLLAGQIAWSNGAKMTGVMPNLSANSSILYENGNSTKVIVGDQTFGPITNTDGTNRVLIRYNSTSGYITGNTLIGVSTSNMASQLGITANKIMAGNTICGIIGTATGSAFVSGTDSVTLTESQSRIKVDFSAKVPSNVRVIWGQFTSNSTYYFVNFRSGTTGDFKPIVWDKYYSHYTSQNETAITGINLGDGDSSHTWSAGTYTYTWYAI